MTRHCRNFNPNLEGWPSPCTLAEHEALPLIVHRDRIASPKLPRHEPRRQRILAPLLDRSFERARSEGWIPPLLRDLRLRRARQLDRNLPLGQPLAQPPQLNLDDLPKVLALEQVEDHD